MSDERRLERLEDKVDKVDEKVEKLDVKIELMHSDLNHYSDIVKEHVAGDGKIITKLEPILEDLGEMVADFKLKKGIADSKADKIKYVRKR